MTGRTSRGPPPGVFVRRAVLIAAVWILVLHAIPQEFRFPPDPRAARLVGAFGLLAHLSRDIATGGGVAILWPLTSAGVRIPFWIEAAAIAALATRAWQLRHLPARRQPRSARKRTLEA